MQIIITQQPSQSGKTTIPTSPIAQFHEQIVFRSPDQQRR